MMDESVINETMSNSNAANLKQVKIKIKPLHCYHCSRTFLFKNAFIFHAHGENTSSSSEDDDDGSETDSSESEDEDELSDIGFESESDMGIDSELDSDVDDFLPRPMLQNVLVNDVTDPRRSEIDVLESIVIPPPTTTDSHQFKCTVCHKPMKTLQILKKHLKFYHNPANRRRFMCPEPGCKHGYPTLAYLRFHTKHKHPSGQNTLNSTKTPSSPPKKPEPYQKKEILSKTNPAADDLVIPPPALICSFCQKPFKTSIILKKHQRLFHVPANRTKFMCPEPSCNKGYPTKPYLRDHVKTHLREPKVTCLETTCPCVFLDRSAMQKHVDIVHPELTPYLCDQCPTSFKTRIQLKNHRKKHKRINYNLPRDCLCSTCGAAFHDNSALKRHLRSHLEPQHKCPFPGCTATYMQRSCMTIHYKKKHANQEPLPSGPL